MISSVVFMSLNMKTSCLLGPTHLLNPLSALCFVKCAPKENDDSDACLLVILLQRQQTVSVAFVGCS